jgi:hypothetical protein
MILAPAAARAEDAPPRRPELTLKQVAYADSDHELSGIFLPQPGGAGRTAYAVADSADDVFIYQLTLKADAGKPKSKDKKATKEAAETPLAGSTRFTLKKVLGLPIISGWSAVQDAMKEALKVDAKDRRLDLEAFAVCGDTWYLGNERVRQVLELTGVGKEGRSAKGIRVLPIDLETAYPKLWEGGANAGIEGLAADCAGGKLYVGKERDPRAILVVDMKTWKVTGTLDLPPSNRDGQRVISPFAKDGAEGLTTLSADVSDLIVEGGFLYVLERNTYEIAKIDLATQKVVARVSYYKAEKPLYETHEPFGVAEALTMTKDEIWIGIDNNGSPSTRWAERTYGGPAKGDHPAIMVFERPAGF